MPDINAITNAAQYLGNSSLGGYIPDAIELDTKPIQQLMAFTVMQNKSLWEQRQKDADDKVKELAELSQYDITNAQGKDKEMAVSALADLQRFAAQYAKKGVPRNPQQKIEQELELRIKTKEATDKIKALTARGIAYQSRLNAINNDAATNGAVKALKKDDLNKEFNEGSWDTPLSSEEKYTVSFPELSKPVYTKNTTSVKDGNSILQQTVIFWNPGKNMEASTAQEVGFLQATTLREGATDQEIREFKLRQATGGELKIFADSAKAVNEVLADPRYRNPDGTLNQKAVDSDNSVAGGILSLIDRSNQYNDELEQDIKRGVYVTRTGRQVNLANVIKEKDIIKIDKDKPLSARQILYLHSFAAAQPDQKDEKIDFTGEDISAKNAETARQNIYLDAAVQREGQANAFKIAKLPYEQMKLSANGATLATQQYSPLASLIAASGGLNKPLDVNKLSKAQVAAINPSWIGTDGELTSEAKVARVSVGAVNQIVDGSGNQKGLDYGVFILDSKGKAVTSLNESNLLSNGASWITTNAKETKGQDVYEYDQDLLRKALGNNAAETKAGTSSGDKTNDKEKERLRKLYGIK